MASIINRLLLEERPETEDSDAESETQMTEVRFVPEDRGLLEAMYHAMSVCQTLHPDPNDSVSEGRFYYNYSCE